jgi:hypothetical protein
MSPMMANASDISPPAPRPWTARKAASSYIDMEIVHNTDPTMKIEMALRKKGLRP